MLGWLLNLGFAGGESSAPWNKNTLYVPRENTTLIVKRGIHSMLTVYLDKDSDAKKVQVDWSDWLDSGQSIASVTWEVENSSTAITVSNTSNTSTVATAYLDCDAYGSPLYVKCTITDDSSIAQTESRSILVRRVRTV